VSREEVKLYFDFKSPFSYLAVEPAFALAARFAVCVRWIPFQLRIKGKGERSQSSEWKAKYSYLDARRWANRRGGFPIHGPVKVYDSTPALIGGLYAEREGFFPTYATQVFSRFFRRQLEIDVRDAIAALVDELGRSGEDYRRYADGEGARAFAACAAEAEADHVFGVPLFFFRGEPFWGHDRIDLLEERLAEQGLGASSPP
jgi:2-hydroxychromene-2-carboxylate isomerase